MEANLAQVDALLAEIPRRRVIERAGLEARRDALVAELLAFERAGTSANVVLAFDGDPVAGAPGIDAAFAGKALTQFQDLVSILDAAKSGEIKLTGRIPDKKASQLRVVGTVEGSFGFELQEADNPMFPSSLSETVGTATRLIAAAGQGDEEYVQIASEVDARAQTKLGSFLESIKSANAICKVVADDTEAMLDKPRMDAAVERVTTTRVEETTQFVDGTFAGVTLETRHFDHRIRDVGGVIKGKVDKSVDQTTMAQWDRKWLNRSCTAVVVRRIASRLNSSRTSYTLLRIEPIRTDKN